MLQATLPEIKLALSSKSRDLLSHVISECMQMRGRIIANVKNKQIVWVACGINHEGILVPGSTGVPANMAAWGC